MNNVDMSCIWSIPADRASGLKGIGEDKLHLRKLLQCKLSQWQHSGVEERLSHREAVINDI